MNILKITKCKNEKSFNDIIKVASFDNNNNIVKAMYFEDIIEFDIDDSVDVGANSIRKENEYLKRINDKLEHQNELYLKTISAILKNMF